MCRPSRGAQVSPAHSEPRVPTEGGALAGLVLGRSQVRAAEALCPLAPGVLPSVGYWVGGIHGDPIRGEEHRRCCLASGFLLGPLIGIHGGREETCFASCCPGGGGPGRSSWGGGMEPVLEGSRELEEELPESWLRGTAPCRLRVTKDRTLTQWLPSGHTGPPVRGTRRTVK